MKVEFDSLEASWREATDGVFVTDRDGVVLITSRNDWRYKTTRPKDAAARDAELDLRQFGIAHLEPIRLPGPGSGQTVAAPFLDTAQPITFGGWHLHLLVNPAEELDAAIAQARLYVLLTLAVLAALATLGLYLRRRRDARAQRAIARQTHDLREQLGQANRLAILGQVTAGVAHEINQPVAAVRLFAENGPLLLERGKDAAAKENFTKIVELVERIGRITEELRNFGRIGPKTSQTVSIGRAIDGALLLLNDRIERNRVELDLPSRQLRLVSVKAEPVRLEQVLVNLLQNAFDAVVEDGRVAIELSTDERFCYLAVRDSGPGLTGLEDRLFQPFATTKTSGLGLGLVISRDIMRELGGELSVTPSKIGACFVMKVPLG